MRLHRLRLRDYRGIEEELVEPQRRGVTIVEGPNEVGKSSLAEALDLLFERKDRSRAQDVDAVVPVDRDVGPEIEVEIETGPYRFTYFKRFRKDKATRLSIEEPTPEDLTGDEAHERALAILEETIDVDLWRALRIQQGTEVSQANLTGQTDLSKALDRAAGGAQIGDEEMALFDAVEETYDEYWTSRGNRRKPFKQAIERVEGEDGLQAQVRELEDQLDELETDVERTEQITQRIRELEGELPDLDEEAQRWSQRLTEVRELRSALDDAQDAVDAAEAEHRRAVQAREDREQLVAEVEAADEELEDASDRLEELEPRLEEARERLAATETAVEESERALEEAQVRERRARDDVEHLRAREELETERERTSTARQVKEERREAERALSAIDVDEELLEAIRTAHSELAAAEERLAEGGPSVELEARSELTATIDEEAVEITSGETFEGTLTDRLDLTVPKVLDLTVEAGRSTDDVLQAREEVADRLDDLLEQAGVDSLEEAVDASQRRRDAIAQRDRAAERLEDLLGDESLEAVEERLEDLQDRIERYESERDEDPPLPETLGEGQQRRREATEDVEGAQGDLAVARAEHEPAKQAVADAEEQVQEARVDHRVAKQTLANAEERLAEAREEASDEELVQAVEETEQALERARDELAEAREELEQADPERVETQAENAQQVLERTREDKIELEKELAGLQESLRVRGREGLHEKLEWRRSELARAERELETTRRRARAVRLLYETMEEERRKAKQAYVAPLREEIEHLGRVVYGERFSVTMDEDLSIRSRTLGGTTVPYEALSVGAQEQLGMITRLAAGIIVAEDEGVPVLVDDALGYSDPSRLKGMGAVLSTAGRSLQVIVLTCMPDRYRHVGDAKVERMRR